MVLQMTGVSLNRHIAFSEPSYPRNNEFRSNSFPFIVFAKLCKVQIALCVFQHSATRTAQYVLRRACGGIEGSMAAAAVGSRYLRCPSMDFYTGSHIRFGSCLETAGLCLIFLFIYIHMARCDIFLAASKKP